MTVEVSRVYESSPKQQKGLEPSFRGGVPVILPLGIYGRLKVMSDAVAIEQPESPEISSSTYLEKIAEKVIPELKVLRSNALEKGDGYRVARSALLLSSETDTAESRGRQMELVVSDVTSNMPDGYRTGDYADRWVQSYELAALRVVYPDSLGWFLNNPVNSNATESVALMRRNFPEYVTNPGLKEGIEGQPDIFRMINSALMPLNRTGHSERPWEDLDVAVNLARAFPERRGELEVGEVKDRTGHVAGEGRFWDVMKGMMVKAVNGELLNERPEPKDLTTFKAEKSKQQTVKLIHGDGARTKVPGLEDRYESNEHAFLVIAAGLVRLFPEKSAELGLTIDDIRRAEAAILHKVSFPFNSGTQKEVIASGEMFDSAVLLEGRYGMVSKFDVTTSGAASSSSPNPNKTA